MSSQTVFNTIGRVEAKIAKRQRIGKPTSVLSIDSLMPAVDSALDLGAGDIRRYGAMYPDTRETIRRGIVQLANHGYPAEARAKALEYRELERQERELLRQLKTQQIVELEM